MTPTPTDPHAACAEEIINELPCFHSTYTLGKAGMARILRKHFPPTNTRALREALETAVRHLALWDEALSEHSEYEGEEAPWITMQNEFAARDKEITELKGLLSELTALVKGECPSLLNEDSGGNGLLEMEISKALDEDLRTANPCFCGSEALHIKTVNGRFVCCSSKSCPAHGVRVSLEEWNMTGSLASLTSCRSCYKPIANTTKQCPFCNCFQ